MTEAGQDCDLSQDKIVTCRCADGEAVEINVRQLRQHSGYFMAQHRFEKACPSPREMQLELVSANMLVKIQDLVRELDSGQFELDSDLAVFRVLSEWSADGKLEELLTVVDYLDMHGLRDLADRFLCTQHEITAENIGDIITICSQFSFTKLEKKVLTFLLKNISNLDTFDFGILSFNVLKQLMGSNKVNVSSEWNLVEVADKWCASGKGRSLTDGQLLKLCSFIRISLLLEHKNSDCLLKKVSYVPLRNCLKSGICAFEDDSDGYYMKHPGHLEVRRGHRLLLAMRVPFGNRLEGACAFSQEFDLHNNEKLVFLDNPSLSKSVPCSSLREFSVCNAGQFVYVVGGQCKYSLAGQFAVNQVYRLDLDTLGWSTVSSMKENRCLFHLDRVGVSLFAVGGINAHGELASVERYNPQSDHWSDVQQLVYTIHEHAGSVVGRDLYISGGHDGKGHVDTVSRYNVDADTWTECSPLLTQRSCHSMVALYKRLYVIGGSQIRRNKVYGLQSVECYSVSADQWTQVPAQFPSLYTACLSVHPRPQSGCILVLGGYSYKNHKYSPSSLEMHRFSESTCSWSRVPFVFNSRRARTDVALIEVRVNTQVADKLVRATRLCTLR